MEEFKAAVADFQREIELIFNEEQNKLFEPYAKQGEITYLIGLVNSLGLREREKVSKSPNEFSLISNALDGYNRQANQAFAKLDELKLLPPVRDPSTGTKKKAQIPVDVSPPKNPPETETASGEEKSNGAETSNPDEIKIEPGDDKKLLDVLLNKISDGFARILNDPNFAKRYQPPEADDDVDDPVLGNPLEIDLTDNFPRAPLAISDDENLLAPSGGTKENKRKKQTDQPIMQLKFDKVELSVFSGEDTEWISFRDEFVYLVHSNDQISNVVKFHLLKTHLRGIALDAINGFKSATDYEAAWQTLIQRYDNQQRIIYGYIRNFLDIPYLSPRPTATQFLRMLNKTNQLIRVLPSFNYDVTSWDPILMFCLTSRLDAYSVRKWNDQIKKRQRVPLSELLEFLEVQASEAALPNDRPNHGDHLKQNKPKPKRANVMVTVKERKCLQCRGEHPLFLCKTYMALNIKEKIKKAKDAKYCLKCLNLHENQDECKFRNCKYCDKPHNDLICYQQHNKKEKEERAASSVPSPSSSVSQK